MQEQIYILEHLGCANCAAKMEDKIAHLPEVESASITFATRQLRISAENPTAMLPEIQRIVASVEPDVVVRPRESQSAQASCTAADGCTCGCAHHDHEHHHEGHHAHDHHEHDHHDHGGAETQNRDRREILIGAALFAAVILLERLGLGLPALLLSAGAYLLLGWEVLRTAGKNLLHGQIFDENFLMSIATLGAFAIHENLEAVGVMLFFRVGEYFEHVAVERSRSQIMEAVDLRPEVVHLVAGDETRTIDAASAAVGDVLMVRPGDRIPLDGVVVSGESRLDTAPITGEPVPVQVQRGDSVTSGCVNLSGVLHIRVEKVLEESMVSRILDAVEHAAARKPKIDRFISRFARIYTPVVIALALGVAIVPSVLTGDWNHWVYTALTFLVMSCPCALVLSVPLAFFCGIGAGSKKGILFKGGASLEAMGKVKAVVLDKTGTLTEGRFEVRAVYPQEVQDEDGLLALCAACERGSNHPIAVSIVQAAAARGLRPIEVQSVEEIAGHGVRAVLPDGSVVLCGNRRLMESQNVTLEAGVSEGTGTEVLAAQDGVFLGRIVVADALKADAKQAVTTLKSRNLAAVMLTGDSAEPAEAVAAELGMDEVYARLLPQDKLERLEALRIKYGPVMFVGDGINDAPVLAGADVGAAMGSGADAAIEAADAVFMTSNVEAVPQALELARVTAAVALQNVVFALAIKAGVMLLGLLGHASMWMAVFADTGVAMLCILNAVRILYKKF